MKAREEQIWGPTIRATELEDRPDRSGQRRDTANPPEKPREVANTARELQNGQEREEESQTMTNPARGQEVASREEQLQKTTNLANMEVGPNMGNRANLAQDRQNRQNIGEAPQKTVNMAKEEAQNLGNMAEKQENTVNMAQEPQKTVNMAKEEAQNLANMAEKQENMVNMAQEPQKTVNMAKEAEWRYRGNMAEEREDMANRAQKTANMAEEQIQSGTNKRERPRYRQNPQPERQCATLVVR
jgi:hypothetical protein